MKRTASTQASAPGGNRLPELRPICHWKKSGHRILAAGLGVLCLGISSQAQAQAPKAKPAAKKAPAQPTFVAGELLVRGRAGGLSVQSLNTAHAAVGANVVKTFGTGWQLVKLPAAKTMAGTTNAIASYKERGVLAEPNWIQRAIATPNDARYSELWGMAKISAPTAWDSTTGSNEVVVAVIDTGVLYGHEDLTANMWRNPGETAGNGIDDDSNGYIDDIYGIDSANGDADPNDDHDHGTHCAGTIGGVGNNGIGVAGVNWNVKIMALKFLTASGGGATSDAIACFDYVRTMKNRGINVRVTNNSWGGGGFSQALKDSIDTTGSAGVINICAAGNDGEDNDEFAHFPSSYDSDSIVSVAASDRNDVRAGFSNIGATSVDLAAPGVGILSSVSDGTYASFNGTSMATPHVAGAAALMLAHSPSTSALGLKTALLGSVDVLPQWQGLVATGGRLNVQRAFLLTDPNAPPIVAASAPSGNRALVGSKIELTFTRAMDRASTEAALSIFPLTPGTFTWSQDDTKMTFSPSSELALATNYAVTLSGSAQSIAGSGLDGNRDGTSQGAGADDHSFGFRTRGAAPNDFFDKAIALETVSGTITGDNVDATAEPGEPVHNGGRGGGKSMWYRWTAASNGTLTFNTNGSDFDTVLAAYVGNSVGSLREIASNDDGGDGLDSLISFQMLAGTTYYIAVDGYFSSSGNFILNWSSVADPVTMSLVLSVSTCSEAGGVGAITGRVIRNNLFGETTVALTNSDPTVVTIPATVTIAPGAISADFPITPINDSIAGGTRTSALGASSVGYPAVAPVTVYVEDDDRAFLAISADTPSVTEGQSTTITITRNTGTSAALNVALSTDPAGSPQITLPELAIIPAGQSSIQVTIVANEELTAEPTQSIGIVATATGLGTASTAVSVVDNDVAALTLNLGVTSVREGRAITATVSRNTPTSSATVVSLRSSNAAQIAVTPVVIIPIGLSSATFVVTAVNDTQIDGPQSATITAIADGVAPTLANISAEDDEATSLSFTISPDRVVEGVRVFGTLRRNVPTSAATAALMVSLSTTTAKAVILPIRVTIPARAMEVRFAIPSIDNTDTQATRAIVITARATGFAAVSRTLNLSDNDNLSLSGQVVNAPGTVGSNSGTVLRLTHRTKANYSRTLSLRGATSYRFTNLTAGVYTLTATKIGHKFNPTPLTVNLLRTGTASTITMTPPPVVRSLSVSRGPAGTIVTLTGNNFIGITKVEMTRGINPNCAYTIQNANTLRVTVGAQTLPNAAIRFVLVTSAGRFTAAPVFTVTIPVAPRDVETASRVSLSSVRATVATASVHLNFTGVLKTVDASDAVNYQVSVNGQLVEVESISLSGSNIVLGLPEGSLRSGDAVEVKWNNLHDNSGAVASGATTCSAP